ncbi:MAG: HSP20-like chaperone, partial [Olpidium bornovanus]
FLFPEGGERSLGRFAATTTGTWTPRVDVTEHEDVIKVCAELPGIPKSKVNVDVDVLALCRYFSFFFGLLPRPLLPAPTRPAASLPALTRAPINLYSRKNNVLSISGENEETKDVDERGVRIRERRYGRFERYLALPSTVDCSKVQAKMDNGILDITIVKNDNTQPKRIPIG